MKARIFPACIALALLGCTTERPTRPAPAAELPAIPLNTPLVQEISGIYESAYGIKDSIEFCFSDEPLYKDGRVDDILFSWETDALLESPGLFAFDPASGGARPVHGALPGIVNWCSDYCWDWGICLFSQIDAIRPIEFLDRQGCLSVLAQNAWNFRSRLIDYSPDYHFVTVRTQETGWGGSNSISVVNDTIWHYQNVWDTTSRRANDSLVGYLRDGSRACAVEFSDRITWGGAFDGTYVWGLTGSSTLSIFTRDGSLVATMPYPSPLSQPNFVAYTGGDVWISRRPFFPNDRSYLDKLNKDSSIATGSAVISLTVELSHRWVTGACLRADQLVFATPDPTNYTKSVIRTMNASLMEIESRHAPVCEIEALAVDGSTIWVLHHGAVQAYTQATLLTRFTLE